MEQSDRDMTLRCVFILVATITFSLALHSCVSRTSHEETHEKLDNLTKQVEQLNRKVK